MAYRHGGEAGQHIMRERFVVPHQGRRECLSHVFTHIRSSMRRRQERKKERPIWIGNLGKQLSMTGWIRKRNPTSPFLPVVENSILVQTLFRWGTNSKFMSTLLFPFAAFSFSPVWYNFCFIVNRMEFDRFSDTNDCMGAPRFLCV